MSNKEINIADVQTKNWLNEEEAAAYIGISSRQLYKLRIHGTPQCGTLPFSKVLGNVRVKRSDIDQYLTRHSVHAEAV